MAEALGIASGIAGLLSLVGQAIEGIIKLRAFAKGFEESAATVNEFVDDLNSFGDSLQQVRDLLKKVSDSARIDVKTLRWQLQSCQSSVLSWNQLTRRRQHGLKDEAKAFFTQLGNAANIEGFVEFQSRISTHQLGLQMSLSMLNT